MLTKRLKLLRTSNNLTQKELASRLDISDARYNQYETGKRTPDLHTLKMIADFYNVSIDYLIGRIDAEDIATIAAHHDGEEWTEDELADIEKFKEFVRMRREQKKDK